MITIPNQYTADTAAAVPSHHDDNHEDVRKLLRTSVLSATITGLIPPAIQNKLSTRNHTSTDPYNQQQQQQQQQDSTSSIYIDPHSCLAYQSDSGGRIYVWEHASSTMQESLRLPTRGRMLRHPEVEEHSPVIPLHLICTAPYGGERTYAAARTSLVVMSTAASTSAASVGGSILALPSYSVFASTLNGVCCMWSHALPEKATTNPEDVCDYEEEEDGGEPPCASVRLSLGEGESVVHVAHVDGTYVVATDSDRLWIVVFKGMQLYARVVQQRSEIVAALSGQRSGGGGDGLFASVRSLWSYDNGIKNRAGSPHSFGIDDSAKVTILYLRKRDENDEQRPVLERRASGRPTRRARNALSGFEKKRSFLAFHPSGRHDRLVIARWTLVIEGDDRTEQLDGVVDIMPDIERLLAQDWPALQTAIDSKREYSIVPLRYAIARTGEHNICILCRAITEGNSMRWYTVFCEAVDTSPVVRVHACEWLSKIRTDEATPSCEGLAFLEDITGTYVAYCFMHTVSPSDVVLCAVHYENNKGRGTMLVDETLSEAFVHGSGFTHSSDGALFVNSEGCVVHVKAHSLSKSVSCLDNGSEFGTDLNGIDMQISQGAADTLARHLFASFQTYNVASHQSISVPPSLAEASTLSLDVCVSRVSTLLLNEEIETSRTNCDIMKVKLNRHQTFINFLKHAGIYRKLVKARMVLCNHGEMIDAISSLFDLLNERSVRLSSVFVSKLASHTHVLTTKCSDLVSSLVLLQQDIFSTYLQSVQDIGLRVECITELSYVLCTAFSTPLIYRREKSSEVYDVVGGMLPWTATKAIRDLLFSQLEKFTSVSGMSEESAFVAEHLSNALLQSYEDESLAFSENTDEFIFAYERARGLAIPTVKKFAGRETAFEMSKTFVDFEGIVSICYEGGEKGFRELTSLINGEFKDVKNNRGEKFPSFVYSYFAKRKLLGHLLDSAKKSNHASLTKFLNESADVNVCNVRWVHAVRTKDWTAAYNHLDNLSSKDDSIGDRKIALSMGKIISRLAQRDNDVFEKRVQLLEAQTTLQSIDEQECVAITNPILSQVQLVHLALKILDDSSKSNDERVHAGVVGLAVSEVMGDDGNHHAALIWKASIGCQIDLWKNISSLQKRFSETKMKEGIFSSIYFGIVMKYLENNDGGTCLSTKDVIQGSSEILPGIEAQLLHITYDLAKSTLQSDIMAA